VQRLRSEATDPQKKQEGEKSSNYTH
jgi:hypothetical protein